MTVKGTGGHNSGHFDEIIAQGVAIVKAVEKLHSTEFKSFCQEHDISEYAKQVFQYIRANG